VWENREHVYYENCKHIFSPHILVGYSASAVAAASKKITKFKSAVHTHNNARRFSRDDEGQLYLHIKGRVHDGHCRKGIKRKGAERTPWFCTGGSTDGRAGGAGTILRTSASHTLFTLLSNLHHFINV
jgi:hypothetical protein